MSDNDVGGHPSSDVAPSPAPSSAHGLDGNAGFADAEIANLPISPNIPNQCCQAMQENLFRAIRSTAEMAKQIQHFEGVEKKSNVMALQLAEQSTYIESSIQNQHELQIQLDRAIAQKDVALQHERQLLVQITVLEQNSAVLRRRADESDMFRMKYQRVTKVAEDLQLKRVEQTQNAGKLAKMYKSVVAENEKQKQEIAQLKLDKSALVNRLRYSRKYVPMMLKTIDELVPLAGDSMVHYTRKRIDTLAQQDVRLQLMGSQAVEDFEDEAHSDDEDMADDVENLISSGVRASWSPRKKKKKGKAVQPMMSDGDTEECEHVIDAPGTSELAIRTPTSSRRGTTTAVPKGRGGGRGARRGPGQAHAIQTIEWELNARLRNKLSREPDADSQDAPGGSSIHGKKGMTVREQQEQQMKGMSVKDRVALMRNQSIDRIPIEASHRLEDSFRMPLASKTPLALPESPEHNPRDAFFDLRLSPSPVKSISEFSADAPLVEEPKEHVTFSLNDSSDLFDDYDSNAYSSMDQLESLLGATPTIEAPSVEVNPLAPEVAVEMAPSIDLEEQEPPQTDVEEVIESDEKMEVGVEAEKILVEEVVVEVEKIVFDEAAPEHDDAPTELSVAIPPVASSPVFVETLVVAPVAVAPSPRAIAPAVERLKPSIVPSPSLPHLEAEWPSASTIRALEVMEMIASELEPPITPLQMVKPLLRDPIEQSVEMASKEPNEITKVTTEDSAEEKSPVKKTRVTKNIAPSSNVIATKHVEAKLAEQPRVSPLDNGPTPLAGARQRVKHPESSAMTTSRKRRLSSTPEIGQKEVLSTPEAEQSSRMTLASNEGDTPLDRETAMVPKIIPPKTAPVQRKPPVKSAPVELQPISRKSERTTVTAPRVSRVPSEQLSSFTIAENTTRRTFSRTRVLKSDKTEKEKDAIPQESVSAKRVAHSSTTPAKDKPTKTTETTDEVSDDPEDDSPYVPKPVRAPVRQITDQSPKRPVVDSPIIQQVQIMDDIIDDEHLVIDLGPDDLVIDLEPKVGIPSTVEFIEPKDDKKKAEMKDDDLPDSEEDDVPLAKLLAQPVKKPTTNSLRNIAPRGGSMASKMAGLKNAIGKRLRQGIPLVVPPKGTMKERAVAVPKTPSVGPAPKAVAVSKKTATPAEPADSKPSRTPRAAKTYKSVPILAEVPRKGRGKRAAEAVAMPLKRACFTKSTAEGLLEKALDMDCEIDDIKRKMSDAELVTISELPAQTFARIMGQIAIRRPTGNNFASVIAGYNKRDATNMYNKSELGLMQASHSLSAEGQNIFGPFIGFLMHYIMSSAMNASLCSKIVRFVILAVEAEAQLQFEDPSFGADPSNTLRHVVNLIGYKYPNMLGESMVYLMRQAPARYIVFLADEESVPLRRIMALYSEKLVCDIACWLWESLCVSITGKKFILPKVCDLPQWMNELTFPKDDMRVLNGQITVSTTARSHLKTRAIYAFSREGFGFVEDDVKTAGLILADILRHYNIGEGVKMESGCGNLFLDVGFASYRGDVSLEKVRCLAISLMTLQSFGMWFLSDKEEVDRSKLHVTLKAIGRCLESVCLLHNHLLEKPPRSPELGSLLVASLSGFRNYFKRFTRHPV